MTIDNNFLMKYCSVIMIRIHKVLNRLWVGITRHEPDRSDITHLHLWLEFPVSVFPNQCRIPILFMSILSACLISTTTCIFIVPKLVADCSSNHFEILLVQVCVLVIPWSHEHDVDWTILCILIILCTHLNHEEDPYFQSQKVKVKITIYCKNYINTIETLVLSIKISRGHLVIILPVCPCV